MAQCIRLHRLGVFIGTGDWSRVAKAVSTFSTLLRYVKMQDPELGCLGCLDGVNLSVMLTAHDGC